MADTEKMQTKGELRAVEDKAYHKHLPIRDRQGECLLDGAD
jgi:hypothetical protein